MSKNLQQIKTEAVDYAADCTDAFTTLRSASFWKENQIEFSAGPDNSPFRMNGNMNDWAFNQLCFRMNVPAGWVGNPKNCPEELKIKILNDLAHDYRDDANLMMRLKGNVVRAVLSSKYAQFDNLGFIDLIAEAVSTMGIEPEIHRSVIGDDMKAYVVFPQVTIAQDPDIQHTRYPGNGGLHPSLYLSNSERGGGSARVVGAVYRSICSNGVIFGWQEQSSFELRHVFHSRAAMGLLVAEGITEGLRMSEVAAKKFVEAQEIKVPQISLGGIVDGWAAKYGITITAKENWLAAITNETIVNGRQNDARLFDVINAATYIAQTREHAETELIERMAGDILAHGHA